MMLRSWWFPSVLSLGMAIYWTGQLTWAQRFVGDVFPVVTPLRIESVTPAEVDGLPGVRIAGSAEKLRGCTYQGIEWRLSGPFGVPLAARFEDPPRVNPVGRLAWAGLLVGITQERLFETYGEAIHTCWGVTVRTMFFDGKGGGSASKSNLWSATQ